MGKILRRNGKMVARLVMYDSPTARLGVVVPRGRVTKLPQSATQAAVKFVDSQTWIASKGRTVKGGNHQLPITLKAETVRKHLELF